MSDSNSSNKKRMATVPLWLVVSFIIGLLMSGGAQVISMLKVTSTSEHLVLEQKIEGEKREIANMSNKINTLDTFVTDKNKEQDKHLLDIDKLLMEVVTNQKNVIKVLDRLEARTR